jgi:hypothetical protein
MVVLGYARVSTDQQSRDQHDALTVAGAEWIFTGKRSGAREGLGCAGSDYGPRRARRGCGGARWARAQPVRDHVHDRDGDRSWCAAAVTTGGDRDDHSGREDARRCGWVVG